MNKQLKYSIPSIAAILLAVILVPTLHTADAATSSSKDIYIVHIKSGDPTDDFQVHSAMMGVEHATAFKKAGKQVVIFLDVAGVKLVDQNRPDELKYHYDTLQSFVKSGGKVIACQHCIEMNDIDSVMKGVTIDKHPTMPALQKALESSKVILDY
jgi:predicted peroxiredoxin